ncbi:GNAT family N-acetyltransferase [Streptomyces sp. NPDC057302]|uniref:GNAT family N-acetyltransferase n=1 Tax=Streptomyces sp. NPDC057302 TaxID=3346094 RepID=UPI0036425436
MLRRPLERKLGGRRHQSQAVVGDGSVGQHVLDGSPFDTGINAFCSIRTAEYVIMLASKARGRGLGTAATRLTLDDAFHITNLRMVWLKALALNAAGIRAYEKAGFHMVGALREAGYWLGNVCDEVVMDALDKDFTGPSTVRAALGGGR